MSKNETAADRLRKYLGLTELPSVAIHPQSPGYTTGMLIGDARAAIAEIERLRSAIRGALAEMRNPGDGGEFEDGEVAAVDILRKALS